MKIQWLGHSSFRLIESTGTTIITDPFDPTGVGYGMAYLSCDAVTSSHGHPGHNHFKGVKGDPIVINKHGTFDVKGVGVTGLSSFHDDSDGARRGSNIIYKFHLDGVTVCHLGDIGEPCSADLVEQLMPSNILLIPVGGNSTIDAEQAKEYVDKLMPDIVIPMHYKTKHTDCDIEKVENFLKLFDGDTVIETEETMEFDRYDFDGESTKVLVPKRYKG